MQTASPDSTIETPGSGRIHSEPYRQSTPINETQSSRPQVIQGHVTEGLRKRERLQ